MKKLLLIFLFILPFQMVGQDADTINGKIINYNGMSVRYAPGYNPLEIWLLSLLEQYETDCYNDSTKITYEVYQNFIGGEEFKVYDPDPFCHYGKSLRKGIDYIHREPTFKGFINWLKERQ